MLFIYLNYEFNGPALLLYINLASMACLDPKSKIENKIKAFVSCSISLFFIPFFCFSNLFRQIFKIFLAIGIFIVL